MTPVPGPYPARPVDIRLATTDDVDRIAEIGLPFIELTGIVTSKGEIADGLRTMMDAGVQAFVAVEDGAVEGVLIFSLYRPWFAPRTAFASEMAWWVNPKHRGTAGLRLLTAFEQWARANDAQPTLSELVGISEVDSILSRRNYRLTERAYVKEVI